MKSFFKYVLATIVGIIAGFFLVSLIFAGVIGIIVASSSKQNVPQVKEKSVLTLSLSHPIPERTSNNPFEHFDFNKLKPIENPGLNDITRAIRKAKTDPKIKGIYIEPSMIPAGWATIESIRNELISFKESGKFIIAFSETMGQKAYYLSSVADKLYITPLGMFQLNGIQAKRTFFKEGLNKLGIEMQVIKGPDNKYKSAIEPFTRENMSKENKYQLKQMLDDLWNNITSDIAISRNIPQENVLSFADNYAMMPSEENIEKNIIDGYKYKDEVIKEIKEKLNIDSASKINTISIGKYSRIKNKKKSSENKIAIVFATGEMVIDSDEPEYMSAKNISKAFRKIRKDSSIKAVVFRINSVGGSALAGEIIWREVLLTNKKIPVIVSMGDVAASGGYYIACPAEKIIAQKHTITGSIGVYGVIPNMKQLFNEKLGIQFDNVKTSERAGIIEVTRPLTQTEKMMLNNVINNTYNTFIKHVADGRGLSITEANNVAKGRVWSSADAKTKGLIDEIGNIDDALRIAAESAGITEYKKINYPKMESPIEMVMKDIANAKLKNHFIKPEEIKSIYKFARIINNDRIQARLPYILEIN